MKNMNKKKLNYILIKLKILFISLIFIIEFNKLYSLGEKSLVSYFIEYPKSKLNCVVGKTDERFILTSKFLCVISYEDSEYVIKLNNGNEKKIIKLHNFGTNENPYFRIIEQDKFSIDNYIKEKLFDESRTIIFIRNSKDITLYLQHNRGINNFLDMIFENFIEIFFDNNEHLDKFESGYISFKACKPQNLEEFREYILKYKDDFPKIDTLDDIKIIYKDSLLESCLPMTIYGCYSKATILSKIITKNYSYEPPMCLYLVGKDIVINTKDLGMVEWTNHIVLFYLNKEDDKIYVLDPYFLQDGVIAFDDWIKIVTHGDDFKIYSGHITH